jgi:hypothetical protein
MVIHTRRDLLRTSLLVGGALSAQRLAGACGVRRFTDAHYVLFVAGNAVAVESVTSTQIAPVPAPVRTPGPVSLAPPTVASVQAPARTLAPSGLVPQTTAPFAYQLSFALGTLTSPIASWVSGAVNHVLSPQNLTLRVYDFNYRGVAATDWTGAVIAQVLWPACDATSTAIAAPVVTVQAVTQHEGPDSSPYPFPLKGMGPAPFRLSANDFRVTLSANVFPAPIVSIGALTLLPATYSGAVALGFNVGPDPIAMTRFEAALQARQVTDITIQYGNLATVTLRNCYVANVTGVLASPTVIMNYADASLSIV